MTLFTAVAIVASSYTNTKPSAGFYLLPPNQKATISFVFMENLVVIPVLINDSIKVNLILDTGCRNLVLFGKKFLKEFMMTQARPIQFSGLGSGKAVHGSLSIGNSIVIGEAMGVNIPVVIVPQKNLFTRFNGQVDGVIGFDLFSRFEVEINPINKQVVLSMAEQEIQRENFTLIKIKVEDCRPVVESIVKMEDGRSEI
ncbi:MAG: retropepsin-like domain-containing protein [Flammeovirgaceae bacterium]|nr:retropepsin-like domain-containing protein [Flammeovirgaceae bacterium]